jgi:hypothetical protein
MLAKIPMVGGPFLLAVGRVVGSIEIEQEVRGHALLLARLQVDPDQGECQLVAGAAIHRVLQPGERRLTGQVGIVEREPVAHQFEERIAPQRRGIVLILVATGNLHDPLPNQPLERMPDGAGAPIRDHGSQGGAEPERIIGVAQPEQTAVTGQPAQIEARRD